MAQGVYPAYPRMPAPQSYTPQALSPPKRNVPPQALWLGIIILLIALVVLGVIFLLLPDAPTPIAFSVQAQSLQVRQGAPLMVTQTLDSAAEPTKIKYTIENVVSKEVVAEKTETITENANPPASVQIPIPSETRPGRYVLNAQVERDGRKTKSSFVFSVSRAPLEIKSKAPPEEAPPLVEKEEILQCPESCSDYNVCTVDRCVAGECRFDSFTPCCGDNICEVGESCPQDCAEKTLQKPEAVGSLVERAVAAAKANPAQASDLCKSLSSVEDRDECFAQVAEEASTYTLCLQIIDAKTKDTCLVDLAIEKEVFVACDHVEDRWLQNSCYSYANLKKLEAS